MKRIESSIQKHLIAWVKEKYPEIIITATANERSYKETAQIGCLGITDLLLFSPCGAILFLELKTKIGKLNEKWNANFDEHFTAPNYKRAVAHGFIQAQEIIVDWVLSEHSAR